MNSKERTYTMRQIADKLGIDKTKVWRYIRSNNIHATSHKGRILLFSERQTNSIIKALNGADVHSKNVANERQTNDQLNMIKLLKSQLETLKNELDQKNNEINQLHQLLDQQQQLNLSTQKLLEKKSSDLSSKSVKNNSSIITPDSVQNAASDKKKPNNGNWFKRLFSKQ